MARPSDAPPTTAPVHTLRVVLGDQCSRTLSALRDLDPAHDAVLMVEATEECAYVPHHPQKIVLVLSAMRHFRAALASRGVRVEYVSLDDPANTGTLTGEVRRAARRLRPGRIVATEPGEWRVLQDMREWEAATGLPVEIRGDDRFLCSPAEFRDWAGTQRTLRMEYFYRHMRSRHHFLMEGDAPAGSTWNLDEENRHPLPPDHPTPPPLRFAPDVITQDVMALVAARFPDNFGTLGDFNWPVTARDAHQALDAFVVERLPLFGRFQDAMATDEPTLFHALVSTSLNCGLLLPYEVCLAAEAAYRLGHVPLNAAEGFIRQVLGWREYMRGIYWLRMPEYRDTNALEAARPLPAFYWGAPTTMHCMHQVVGQIRDLAYAHHIQRLMVTGNFALLAGIAPAEVNAWYLAVFADAYEWVELPNTHGMALHADGGLVGSKPYAASGAYINRMSDYCRHCVHDVSDDAGPRACPFNTLYWDFLARHAEHFAGNPRLAAPLRALERMAPDHLAAVRARAAEFLDGLDRPAPAPPVPRHAPA